MRFAFVFATTLLFVACKPDYEKTAARELATGIRNDSIFFGIYLGMPRADFYKRCLELNGNGTVTNGPKNNTALHIVNGYSQPIDMNFYPDFSRDSIYNMRVYFNYQAWAPWNKEYYADKLVPEALQILEKRYGSGFSKQKSEKGFPFWFKVDGNRAITVRVADEKDVLVHITDLSVTPEKTEAVKKPGELRPAWER
jgi:hypothetical protein